MKTTMTIGAIAVLVSAAQADVTFTITETGSSVLVTGTGSFDLTGLTLLEQEYNTGSIGDYVWPSVAGLSVGEQAFVDVYDLADGGFLPFDQTGAEPFGPGSAGYYSSFAGDVWAGDYFGLYISRSFLDGGTVLYDYGIFVPTGYQSGDTISGSIEIMGESLASRGIDLGTFVSHFGNNTVTVNVVATPPCPVDLNGDSVVDNGDIGTFVALFLAGDLAADFTGDGILDNGDIGAFVAAFLAGC